MTVKSKKTIKTPENHYFKAVDMIDETTKYLKKAGGDKELLNILSRLTKYLKSRKTSEIHTILGHIEARQAVTELTVEQESEEELANLNTGELRQRLTDPKMSRNALERIAKIRFGVSTGALSILRDKESLLNKLITLIDNESTHDSIAKLASIHKLPPT